MGPPERLILFGQDFRLDSLDSGMRRNDDG